MLDHSADRAGGFAHAASDLGEGGFHSLAVAHRAVSSRMSGVLVGRVVAATSSRDRTH
jgi:hypothetical protein